MSTTVAIAVVHFTDEAKNPLLATAMRVPIMDAKITVRDFAGEVLYRFFNMFNQRPAKASVKALLVDNSVALFSGDRLLDVVNIPTETITIVLGNMSAGAGATTTSPKDVYKSASLPSSFLISTPRGKQAAVAPPGYHDSPLALGVAPPSNKSSGTPISHQHPTTTQVTPPNLWDDDSQKAFHAESGEAATAFSSPPTAGSKRQRDATNDDASPAPKPPVAKKESVMSMIQDKLAETRREEPEYFQKAISASPANPMHHHTTTPASAQSTKTAEVVAPTPVAPVSTKTTAVTSTKSKKVAAAPPAAVSSAKAKEVKPTKPAPVAAKSTKTAVTVKKSSKTVVDHTTPPTTAATAPSSSRSPELDLEQMPTPERKAFYKANEGKKNWGTKAHLFFPPNYEPDLDKVLREARKQKKLALQAEKDASSGKSPVAVKPVAVAVKPAAKAKKPVAATPPTTPALAPSSQSPDLEHMPTPERKAYYEANESKKNWGTKAHLFFAPNYEANIERALREARKQNRLALQAEKDAAATAAAAAGNTDPHKVAANVSVVEDDAPVTTPPSKVNRSLFSAHQPEKKEASAKKAAAPAQVAEEEEEPEVPRPKGWGPEAHAFFPSFYNADPRKAVVPPELLNQPIRARRRD